MGLDLNIISDGKLYIDFSNGAGQAGSFQLTCVESLKDASDRSRDNVNAIGVPDAAGTQRKKGGGKLTLAVYYEAEIPQVNWVRMDTDNVVFSLRFVPDNAGQPITWYRCEVSTVGVDLNSDGKNTFGVDVTYKSRE